MAAAEKITEDTSAGTPRREDKQRRIRSYVRREGRLTRAQARALRELLPRYGIGHPGPGLEPEAIFGRRAPLTLEIGFGNGEALLSAARAHPERDYLGVEVHRPGVGRLLNGLAEAALENVRVICADAAEVVRDRLPDDCLDACWIFFPDPWPKKRHHKRRLIQPGFAHALASRLKAGGILHLATDWTDYAEHMLEVLDAEPLLVNTAGRGRCSERPEWRPETRFEARGARRGHPVHDLVYERANPDDVGRPGK